MKKRFKQKAPATNYLSVYGNNETGSIFLLWCPIVHNNGFLLFLRLNKYSTFIQAHTHTLAGWMALTIPRFFVHFLAYSGRSVQRKNFMNVHICIVGFFISKKSISALKMREKEGETHGRRMNQCMGILRVCSIFDLCMFCFGKRAFTKHFGLWVLWKNKKHKTILAEREAKERTISAPAPRCVCIHFGRAHTNKRPCEMRALHNSAAKARDRSIIPKFDWRRFCLSERQHFAASFLLSLFLSLSLFAWFRLFFSLLFFVHLNFWSHSPFHHPFIRSHRILCGN